jgi:hypothetical protein
MIESSQRTIKSNWLTEIILFCSEGEVALYEKRT